MTDRGDTNNEWQGANRNMARHGPQDSFNGDSLELTMSLAIVSKFARVEATGSGSIVTPPVSRGGSVDSLNQTYSLEKM